jgi:hypothetical protein
VTTRVYVPSSLGLLRELLVSGGVGPVPVLAHAVTESLRSALPDADEEEWEYAALTAAAQDSLALTGEDEEEGRRRVVVVAEADSVVPVAGAEDGLVELDEVVPLRKVVAVHVDSEEAGDDVAAARAAWPAAQGGDADALAVVDRCLDHELGWFATQEIGDLLGG